MQENARQIFDRIIKGDFQQERRGNLRQPFVKLALVAIPLLAGTMALLLRYYGLHYINYLILIFLIIIFCQSLDFRPSGMARTIRWLLIFITGIVLTYLSAYGIFSLEQSIDLLGLRRIISFIGKAITGEDILIFLLFALAARGIRLFNSSDVLILSRFLYFRRLKQAYFTVIFTFYISISSVERIIGTAWATSKNKSRLAYRSRGWVGSRITGATLFLYQLLTRLEELARQTNSILRERGFYSKESQNVLPKSFSSEDICVTIILVMSILIFIPLR